jgi:general secretion pathway protein D
LSQHEEKRSALLRRKAPGLSPRERQVAKRRSELNATRMQTTCVLAGVSLLSVCLAPHADATPAVDLILSAALAGQVSAPDKEALSRSDVDNLLRQAQEAIQDRNFDQAEVLVDRAERAQIHYPLIYFGPTPSSVRRELTHAEQAQPATPKPTPSTPTASDDRYAVNTASYDADAEPTNPFARPQPLLPSALATQPGRPSLTTSDTAAVSPASATRQLMTSAGAEPAADKAQAVERLSQARQALNAGDLDLAENLARATSALGVPESQFLPNEDRPSLLAWDVMQARAEEARGQSANANQVTRRPQQTDAARVSPASAGRPASPSMLAPPETNPRLASLPAPFSARQDNPATVLDMQPYMAPNDAAMLLEEGEAALQRRDQQTALECFRQAYQVSDQLDPAGRQRLQEHLQMLAGNSARGTASPRVAAATSSLIDMAGDAEQVLARQLSADVGKCQSEARRMREQDPQRALAMLQDMRQQVQDSRLPEEYRSQLLHRLDITTDDTQKYINDHRAEIELSARNRAVLDEVDRNREVKVKVQQQVADLVDQFNTLRDEQRYAEMEVVARRLIELAPEDEVARQVWQMAKFIRREMMNRDLRDRREESFWAALNDTEKSAIVEVGDGKEMIYDQKRWDALVKHRTGLSDRNNRRTERELEIERRLKTPVLLRYEDTPLSQVVEGLSQLAGVNIHLDPRGLSQEGIHSDTPITINLTKEISLESALNLILEPLHLSYVVKDEVLKITSEQLRDGELVTVTYNVADLVIPIPNFVPSNNIGLQGLINDSYAAMGYGQGLGMPGPTVLLSDRGPRVGAAAGNETVLAQQFGANATPSSSSVPIGGGPGGMGGGANADFDSLIDLIVSTVATETWAENGGGEAEIREFPTNLSIVISQTQAVHEEIADLLEQLRRLQDLQVTIEVRYITLNDNFFERIGVDFIANIQDRSNDIQFDPVTGGYEEGQQSAVVGITRAADGLPEFTADLDIPYRQGLFTLSRPAFGGADPTSFATFGYAILSDIEAYFLVEAAQGDSRTNVLNAPKVTLFNGQQAMVADAIQQPFVMGVIPVVGEFAAAQQPVIVVLNEGTMMSIQAVVSDDRRYVRLTVVPFFTQIGDVDTFTFEGTTSSTTSSSSSEDDESTSESESDEAVHTGVTVQLPAFQFVTVVTTVSVPDGGTVLLGGIKRLSEGRSEYGVPLLSKVPYVNRLFRNVGIGRETSSLMMMVTPRIIIQEEEEEKLGIATE